MAKSFLPNVLAHTYDVNPKYAKSVAYFSMEFAIDNMFKIYSGGLGYLSGSHMRSAYDLRQNLCGVGILWSYGYYNQVRGEDRQMAVQFRRKNYQFLEDHNIKFQIRIRGALVWVKALYLRPDTFETAPMFFLTTDIEENDYLAREISHCLYAQNLETRIAQYILLGVGGARLFEELGVEPEVYHLNEAHAIGAALYKLDKTRDLEAVRSQFVFTTHTPEEAGNEKHSFHMLHDFSMFGNLTTDEVRHYIGVEEDVFNYTLSGLRLSRKANGVSKLHGEVSRSMWAPYADICPIIHITNAQNKRFWADKELEEARLSGDKDAFRARKIELKKILMSVVGDQGGRIFDPKCLTIVWARRFAAYKRPDLITGNPTCFERMIKRTNKPVQFIWAGKPYPFDKQACDLFDQLNSLSTKYSHVATLVGYELGLSRLLKCGADVWLNNPIVTREASGTSGMSAAMNGAVNVSTDDGWICEFAKTGVNSFVIPPAGLALSEQARDRHDRDGFYDILEDHILPMYYDNNDAWMDMVFKSMGDVAPFFDSDRMADQYYEEMYNG